MNRAIHLTFTATIARLALLGVIGSTATWLPDVVWASGIPSAALAGNPQITATSYWFLLAAGTAFLVPAGLVLIGAAGLHPQRAWDAALGGLAAVGLAGLGYWAVGFALQFGGIGLVHVRPELSGLVWEWSALPPEWGTGWGMAGLRGWFLSGDGITAMAYTLFLAHLPWAIAAALLPMIALRGRAPAFVTLLLALLTGGVLYPVAGNWVQGGGWLAALGQNLELGHGLVDFGGAGTVYLVAAGLTLAVLFTWLPRRPSQQAMDPGLPPVHLPLLAVVGALLLLAGVIGWSWANPLHADTLPAVAPLRGSVNNILSAAGGVLFPLLYTWFVSGNSDPLMSARGLAAGAIAGMACGPFVPPSAALVMGLLAGLSVPFVTFVIDRVLRLDDAAGVLSMSGAPSLIGLLAVGIWADGTLGRSWQLTGANSYLGITGQGVSGIFVASGYQMDLPGQIQAQITGILALGLWGFLTGLLLSLPLALVVYSLQRPVEPPPQVTPGSFRQAEPPERPVQMEPPAGPVETVAAAEPEP